MSRWYLSQLYLARSSKAQFDKIDEGYVPDALLDTNSERRFLRDAKYAAGAVVDIASVPISKKKVASVNCVIIS